MTEQKKPDDFVNVTDCLEAVGSFKSMKNLFFIVVLVGLIVSQGCFWLVNFGYVRAGESEGAETVKVEEVEPTPPPMPEAPPADPNDPNAIAEAATEAIKDVNTAGSWTDKEDAAEDEGFTLPINLKHVLWIVKLCNFILIPASILYSLVLVFSLKVSLLGRLGGINHISRAFFLSLFMVVFLMPWQLVFGPSFVGAIYTPSELAAVGEQLGHESIMGSVGHYLRFTGWWIVIVLLLCFAQYRSGRWSNATLKRLGIA